MSPRLMTDAEMKSSGSTTGFVWDLMRQRCPYRNHGNDTPEHGTDGPECVHQENRLWSTACEFDACPFTQNTIQETAND